MWVVKFKLLNSLQHTSLLVSKKERYNPTLSIYIMCITMYFAHKGETIYS